MLTSTVPCLAQTYFKEGQAVFLQGCPVGFQQHALRLNAKKQPRRLKTRVANPRHNDEKKSGSEGTGSWDEHSSGDAGQPESDAEPGPDSWAKAQSFAVLLGAATLSAVLTIQLSGKANLPDLAYQKLPEVLQEALPKAPGDKNQFSFPQFGFGAAVQGYKDEGNKQKGGLNLPFAEQSKPKGNLNLPFEGSAKGSDDRQKTQDKVKAERQQNFDRSQQKKGAKTEQSRKDKQQRMKQKEQEKEAQNRQREREKQEAERREKERKEKERKENEKRKKFRDQALVGGSIFGVSALTFGKWQLVASLGAVVFRTVGGPTILSSVLRTPGYIIGRGVRVVEWDVCESPWGPTGHLVSMKLRALTPDGIRIAIAKEYGLSNYREVRQVSHWVTNTTPYFFEPMRTAATFKMLPDPAFVVWSKHPPSGPHKLPTRSKAPQPADTPSQDPLEGLTTDQVVAVMLKAISGVAATSRRQLSPADRALAQLSGSNGSSQSSHHAAHSSNGTEQQADVHAGRQHAHAARHSNNGTAGVQPDRQNESASSEHDTGTAVRSHQQQSASAVASRHEVGQQSSDPQGRSGQSQHAEGVDQNQHQYAHSQQGSASTNSPSPGSEQDETGHQRNSSRGQSSSQSRSSHSEPFASRDDEVAGALQSEGHEDHSNSQSTDSDGPLHWDDDQVLQSLCDSTNVSAESWGERLQLPSSFQSISEEQEERLVMAACKANGKMLPLFHAYAPHNMLTFVRFARLYCSEV